MLLAFVPRPRVLLLISIAGLVSGGAQAAFVLMIGRIAASLAEAGDTSIFGLGSLTSAFAVSAALLIIMGFCYAAFSSLSARLLGEATDFARAKAMRRFLAAGWESQADERPGEFQEIVNGHVNRIGLGINSIAQVLLAITSMGILLAVATFVSPLTAALVVLASAPLFIVLRPVFRRISVYGAERGEAAIELGASVSQTVNLGRDITVFGVNEQFRDRLGNDINALTRPVIKGQFYRVGTPLFFQVIVFALLLFGLVITWQLDVADLERLSITVLLFLRAMMYARDLQRGLVVFADALPYVTEYNRRLARFVPSQYETGNAEVGEIEQIELRDYSYSYPNDTTAALRAVSFSAYAGEAIGIVGPSGSGKSTLAEILLRLRTGDGDYLVNGKSAEAISSTSWSQTVAYVSQRPALLHATVTDNIRFLREHVTDADVRRAADLAQIHNEIENLPKGYDTLLGGLHGQLSGGQAQRVCIARALAGSPLLLILDEPTSALDTSSEAQIRNVLADLKGRVTSFVITHRLAAVDHCDRIVHLDDGEIVRIEDVSDTTGRADVL